MIELELQAQEEEDAHLYFCGKAYGKEVDVLRERMYFFAAERIRYISLEIAKRKLLMAFRSRQ